MLKKIFWILAALLVVYCLVNMYLAWQTVLTIEGYINDEHYGYDHTQELQEIAPKVGLHSADEVRKYYNDDKARIGEVPR